MHDQPRHPLPAMATFELRDYRRQLEHSLRALPAHAPAHEQLRQRLDEVLAEEQSRAEIAGSSRA